MSDRIVQVEVIGETPGGKACTWGLLVDGVPHCVSVRGRRIRQTFDTKRAAEKAAAKLKRKPS